MYSKTVIDAVAPLLDRHVDMGNQQLVIANLAFMQQAMIAIEGLIKNAIKLTDGPLRDYFISHLEEESDHAQWLSEDLLTVGVNMQTLPKIRRAVEMAGAQYYLINHVNPLSLLGYMAVLEGFPISLKTVDALENTHGKELLRTLRFHAEHDVDHRKELFAIIDQYPSQTIMHSALLTAQYISELSQDLNSGELYKFIKDNE